MTRKPDASDPHASDGPADAAAAARRDDPLAVDDNFVVRMVPPDVFIIDDDKPLAEVFHQVLERRGLSARAFGGRAEIAAMPADQWASLMILDLSLGESDAVEVIRLLSQRGYGGAVALMSGRGEQHLQQVQTIGLRHGLTMLTPLAKPIRSDQIDTIVRYVGSVERHQPRFDLETALDGDWIEFWYQPQVALGTNAVTGMESLARMRHPTAGVLTPDTFLPSGPSPTLDRLTEAAILAACRDWETMRAAGIGARISVNAPVSSLTNPDFIPFIRASAPRNDGWPGLTIEITESELIRDIDGTLELAVQLALHRVDISIDDFGKGYSSLSRLRALPFAEIKIDRSFVAGVSADPRRGVICEMSVALAHRFGRRIVAEGIEKRADLATLKDIGCDIGQGFYFARPQPLDEVTRSENQAPPISA